MRPTRITRAWPNQHAVRLRKRKPGSYSNSMSGEDADLPDPTGALFMPTTNISWSDDDQTRRAFRAAPQAPQSSQLAWSQDTLSVEPVPFEYNEEPTEHHIEPRYRFDWIGWTGPIILILVAMILGVATFCLVFLSHNFVNTGPHVEHPTTHQPSP
jgi:hypothetical protein